MTVIRVHELAKKMKVESKEILAVLERMGIKGKTATSGLDDKETKSLIDKLKALRKEKERSRKDGGGGVAVSREDRQKKAAALIGKFSSTLERPGAKPKSAMGAPPVIPPPGAVKKEPAARKEPARATPPAAGSNETVKTERPAPPVTRRGRPAKAEPFNALPGLAPTPPMPPPPAGRATRKKWQKKHAERERMQEREFREKPSFKKLPDLKTLPSSKKPHRKEEKHGIQTDVAEITKPRQKAIKFQEGSTVKEFAEIMGQKVGDVIKKLMGLGMLATQNQAMDMDAATLLADQYGMKVEVASLETAEDWLQEKEDEAVSLQPRPPMVTIMGHVDHGKTSLLDAIRETNVVAKEAGGITQHIGAYQVSLKGREITFLDTPGHEAFTAMRARGAQVTDIVILVVAADDGVMPQTREAVNHAKAAGVPIIVAVNKIDKPDAKPERVKQELTELELVPEDWGGETIFCEVSAKQHMGIEHLLEMILIQSDVLELKANPDKLARGTIIEAKLDRGRGPVATVLVQGGTLKVGDIFVSGVQFGRVRALINDLGGRIESAAPSVPAEVIGFSGVPQAGDGFIVVEEERKARQVAEFRMNKQRTAEMAAMKKVTLEDLHSQIQEGMVKELNIVLKADVQGSVGAIVDALTKLSTQEVKLRVIHSSVGAITETDVMLATASNAIIIGFSVRPEPKASEIASREGVDIRLYNVIYNAVDDIKAAMEGLLEPTLKERVLGRAEVRQTFHVSKVGTIAGCYVQDGVITRQSEGVRVLRDNVVVYEGKLHSLKRFKDDVREVQSGYECGIAVENFNDIKVGDIIEAYAIDKVAAKL